MYASRTRPLHRIGLCAALVALLLPTHAMAGKTLYPKGNGVHAVKVEANFEPISLSELQVTQADEDDYCEIFRQASDRIWKATNGQHYYESVHFGYGASEADVMIYKGGRSRANGARILLEFPAAHPDSGDDTHSGTLAHEWGHYFYYLADEYLEGKDLGICQDSLKMEEECTAFPQSSCASNARCIVHDMCDAPGQPYDGYMIVKDAPDFDPVPMHAWGVVSVNQCMGQTPGGVCVLNDPTGEHTFGLNGPEDWPMWGASCSANGDCDWDDDEGMCTSSFIGGSSLSVCVGANSCTMADHDKDTWCDGSTHEHFDADGKSLSHQTSLMTAASDMGASDAEGYNCWDRAIDVQPTLQFDGTYDSVGFAPSHDDPDFCTWDVPDYTDVQALEAWSTIVIDASGSMFADANGNPAWKYAAGGAEFFNQVAFDDNKMAGVYAFGDVFWTVQWASVNGGQVVPPAPGAQEMTLGIPIDLGQASVAMYKQGIGDYVDELHTTDLCAVLKGARDEFDAANAPLGDREVVLLTDAEFTTEPWSVDASCEGVDAWIVEQPDLIYQLCDGMKVNVVSTGPNPNTDLADWVADSCQGWHYYAGDAQVQSGNLPHSAKVHASLSKAIVDNQDVALHERSLIDIPSLIETRSFTVPDGTDSLRVAWIGTPYVNPLDDSIAFDDLIFELESPSGILYNPNTDTSEVDGQYRRIGVLDPEEGEWVMRIDKTLMDSYDRVETEVGWIATLDHPRYLAQAWTDRAQLTLGDTVRISGSVTDGEYGIGSMNVQARLSASGTEEVIDLYDDGLHGDGEPGDGLYAADYVPTVEGPFSVKVDFDLIAGQSETIPGESLFGTGPGPELLTSSATLIAHTAFETRFEEVGRLTASLPTMSTGTTSTGLTATIEGRYVHAANVSLGEGVLVENTTLTCLNCVSSTGGPLDPAQLTYQLQFDASVDGSATGGPRDLVIEVGEDDYVLPGAATVYAPPPRR